MRLSTSAVELLAEGQARPTAIEQLDHQITRFNRLRHSTLVATSSARLQDVHNANY